MKNRAYTVAMVLLVAVCFSSIAGAMTAPDRFQAQGRHQSPKTHKAVPDKVLPMQYMGVSENNILTQSLKLAGLAKAMGVNLVRVNIKFQLSDPLESDSSVDPSTYMPSPDDLQQLCNAAKALVNINIKNLMLTFMPTLNTGYPQSPTALDELNNIIDSYLAELYGPTGCANASGVHMLSLMLQPGNEMNIDTFCQPQNDSDHRFCAQVAAVMQASVYDFVKKSEVPKYGLPITVVGASVASHHTPYLYLSEYQHKMNVLTHCSAGCMDVFDFHPYALWGSCDQMSGFKMYPNLMSAVSQVFGKPIPILYGEWAVQTKESNTEGYLNTEPWNCLVVPEDQLASVWTSAIGYAGQQQVLGLVNEHICDEQRLDNGFQSGLMNWTCDRRKLGFAAISQMIQSAHQ